MPFLKIKIGCVLKRGTALSAEGALRPTRVSRFCRFPGCSVNDTGCDSDLGLLLVLVQLTAKEFKLVTGALLCEETQKSEQKLSYFVLRLDVPPNRIIDVALNRLLLILIVKEDNQD